MARNVTEAVFVVAEDLQCQPRPCARRTRPSSLTRRAGAGARSSRGRGGHDQQHAGARHRGPVTYSPSKLNNEHPWQTAPSSGLPAARPRAQTHARVGASRAHLVCYSRREAPPMHAACMRTPGSAAAAAGGVAGGDTDTGAWPRLPREQRGGAAGRQGLRVGALPRVQGRREPRAMPAPLLTGWILRTHRGLRARWG